MKVQFIKSACVVVEHEGIRILCDPWLTDGIYYGSWYHFPPLAFKPQDFSSVDYIYISHIHPDHLDPATLTLLPKNIPILIHNYAEKFVLNLIRKLGFQTIHEVSHGDKFYFSDDFYMEILAGDNCDPEMCGRYFQCSVPSPYKETIQIDSMGVFHGGGKTVVNTNDCPYGLAKKVCDLVLKEHAKVDFLLVGYSGAAAYPQCFDNLPDHLKRQEARAHRSLKLEQCISFLKHLKPKAFMPFAGQYVLGGKCASMNAFISPPPIEELPQIFQSLMLQNSIESEFILLNSGAFYDIHSTLMSESFIAPNPMDREAYIKNNLSNKKFDYESDQLEPFDLTEKLKEAHVKMRSRQHLYGSFSSEWNIYIDAGQEYVYAIPLSDDHEVRTIMRNEYSTPYLRIGLDFRLLMRILDRKAHWNNAEIGSHLHFYREPNIYHRSIHLFMSYFHC